MSLRGPPRGDNSKLDTAHAGQYLNMTVDNDPPNVVIMVLDGAFGNSDERRPDPYVEAKIGTKSEKTKKAKNANRVQWNEPLTFRNARPNDVLHIAVKDSDINRDDVLLRDSIPLSSLPRGRSQLRIPRHAAGVRPVVAQGRAYSPPRYHGPVWRHPGTTVRKGGVFVPGYVAEQDYGVPTGYTQDVGIAPVVADLARPQGYHPFAQSYGSYGGPDRPTSPLRTASPVPYGGGAGYPGWGNAGAGYMSPMRDRGHPADGYGYGGGQYGDPWQMVSGYHDQGPGRIYSH